MTLKLVDLTLKVPEGSEEFVKKLVHRELKEFVTKTREADISAIDAEIKSEMDLIKEANGLVPIKI